jgi:hypothetical protein
VVGGFCAKICNGHGLSPNSSLIKSRRGPATSARLATLRAQNGRSPNTNLPLSEDCFLCTIWRLTRYFHASRSTGNSFAGASRIRKRDADSESRRGRLARPVRLGGAQNNR